MKVHYKKTWPEYFELLSKGIKKFEVRKNDCNYQVGDTFVATYFDPNSDHPYSYNGKGRNDVAYTITYILNGGIFGVENGFCVLQLEPIEPINFNI